MLQRKLGHQGLQTSMVGFGCKSLSEVYGERDSAQAQQILLRAQAAGINYFDSADIYGDGHNETLLRACFAASPEIQIGTKCGIVRFRRERDATRVNSSPAHIKTCVHDSLKRLAREQIDILFLHRIDNKTLLEDSVATMADCVQAGKVRYLGLCEVSAHMLERAHRVHPISVIQAEYSLWAREAEHNGVLQTCRELGIGLMAYSPLGRGLLTGKFADTSELPEGDFEQTMGARAVKPVDTDGARQQALVSALCDFADARCATPAQIALAWVLAQGDFIVPIPGIRQLRYLTENVESVQQVTLSANEVTQLNELSAQAGLGDESVKV